MNISRGLGTENKNFAHRPDRLVNYPIWWYGSAKTLRLIFFKVPEMGRNLLDASNIWSISGQFWDSMSRIQDVISL